jgi:WASH complex subunit CCDC53
MSRYFRKIHSNFPRKKMQAPVDYKLINPVFSGKTTTAVNNFVIHTTLFLNRFSYICEQKLGDVSRNVERLEITLNLLEAKLASLPGLDGGNVSTQAAASVPDIGNSTGGEESLPPPIPPPPSGIRTFSTFGDPNS